MPFNDLAYLFFLTFALCVSYFAITPFQKYFFENRKDFKVNKDWPWSVGVVFLTSLCVYAISLSIPNIEFGNRIIHMFGGGFLAYMVSYLAARDSGLKVDKVKFFIFTFMMVMTLGIVNEIVEFFLQNVFHFVAAPNVNDTWFDLISNFLGAALAGSIFTRYLK